MAFANAPIMQPSNLDTQAVAAGLYQNMPQRPHPRPLPDAESDWTDVTRECSDILQEVVQELQDELAVPLGRTAVSRRELRAIVRRAMPAIEVQGGQPVVTQEGDPQAMAQLEQFAVDLGHQDGDSCALCKEINAVLNERSRGNGNGQ